MSDFLEALVDFLSEDEDAIQRVDPDPADPNDTPQYDRARAEQIAQLASKQLGYRPRVVPRGSRGKFGVDAQPKDAAAIQALATQTEPTVDSSDSDVLNQVNQVTEGTWSFIPGGDSDATYLAALMNSKKPVPLTDNLRHKLYSMVGDDQFFDDLDSGDCDGDIRYALATAIKRLTNPNVTWLGTPLDDSSVEILRRALRK